MGANTFSPRETRAVLDGLRHIVRALRLAARGTERAHGVSAAQLFVLDRLAAAEPLTIGDLAEHTLTHQSSVSIVVARLAARGLVARRPSREDARRTEVRLTARGRALLARTPEPVQARLIDAIGALARPTRRALALGLAALAGALGDAVAPAPLFFEHERRR
jgi:MarR family transcriptional regulator, lower aerobic nicotinate degradation pathway regulator